MSVSLVSGSLNVPCKEIILETPTVIVWSVIAKSATGRSFTSATVTVTCTLVARRPSLALTVIV